MSNNSTSSPPPPSNASPPPPSSSTPPPSAPPPPSQDSSPPPPSPASPPPPSGSGSPPPSPPPPPSNNNDKSPPSQDNNNNNKSPPPPPNSNSGSSYNGYSYSRPPPPPSSGSSFNSLTSSDSSSSDDHLSNISSMISQKVMLIGVAAGAGLLLLIMVVFLISCARRRKRKPRDMQYYRDNSRGNNINYYNSSGGWPNNAPRASHEFRMPPSAQVSSEYDWPVKPPPPPPAMMSTGELHSAHFSSGSQRHGQTPPPLHPQMSIGYNQSSFSYEDLASATGGFASANLLGQGGFGYVHKGVLPNGKEVAVKSLKANSGQGEREFQAEVDIISRVHHRHLVSLVGYCIAGSQRMLVYEFVAHDTLESHLHGTVKTVMDWPTRLTIAIGSAKGFAYLHEDCHPRIIHRDIKASNILLDENFEAKVADFGLAKLSNDTNTHVSTRIMGTFGYLAPEYAASGKLSEKSDVYSYGVVLLELITGKRPIDIHSDEEDSLVDWARPILASALEGECGYEELADPLLEGNYDPKEMQRMIACAAACVRHSARRRPKMSQVVRALEGDGTLADLDEAVKTSRTISTSSSEYDLQKMRKTGLSSQEFSSNEFAHSSGGESREMSSNRVENVHCLA